MNGNSTYRVDYAVIDYNGFPVLYSDEELFDQAVKYVSPRLGDKQPLIIIVGGESADLVYFHRFKTNNSVHDLVVVSRIHGFSGGNVFEHLIDYLARNNSLDEIPRWNSLESIEKLKLVYPTIYSRIAGVDEEYVDKLRKGIHEPIIVKGEEYIVTHKLSPAILDRENVLNVLRDLFIGVYRRGQVLIKTPILSPTLYSLLHLSRLYGVRELVPTVMTTFESVEASSLVEKISPRITIMVNEAHSYSSNIGFRDPNIDKYLEITLTSGFVDQEIILEMYRRETPVEHMATYLAIVVGGEVDPSKYIELYKALKSRGINGHALRRMVDYLLKTYRDEEIREKISVEDYVSLIRDAVDKGLKHEQLYEVLKTYEESIDNVVNEVCKLYNRDLSEDVRAFILHRAIVNIDKLRDCPFKILDELSLLNPRVRAKLLVSLGERIGYGRLLDTLQSRGFEDLIKELLEVKPELREQSSKLKERLVIEVSKGNFEFIEGIGKPILEDMLREIDVDELIDAVVDGVLVRSRGGFAKYLDKLFNTCLEVVECRVKLFERVQNYVRSIGRRAVEVSAEYFFKIYLIDKFADDLRRETLEALARRIVDPLFSFMIECINERKDKNRVFCLKCLELYKHSTTIHRYVSPILSKYVWGEAAETLFNVNTSKFSPKNIDKLLKKTEAIQHYRDHIPGDIYGMLLDKMRNILYDYMTSYYYSNPKKFAKIFVKKNYRATLTNHGFGDIAVKIDRLCRKSA